MKLVFTLLLLHLGLSYGSQNICQGAYMRSVLNSCALANGRDFVHISDLLGSKLARNVHGKCFRACVYLKCGYYNYDGTISHEVAWKLGQILHGGDYSHVKPIEATARKCLALQTFHRSLCDTTEEFVQCLLFYAPVRYKLYGVYD